MKTAFKIILLIAVASYLCFAVINFTHRSEERVCEAVDIIITDSLTGGFVNDDYIHGILTKNKIFAEGQLISNINLQQIEQYLTDDPYIEEASCYYSASCHLCVTVKPQNPVLHVMTKNGDEYYLDCNGNTMPVGNFNVDLCIATGNIMKKYAKKRLSILAQYIHDDEFLNEEIQQIYVEDTFDVQLIPRQGDHIILLGNIENYVNKLNRLKLFYQEGFPTVGWNKYKTINLAFDQQVVCTKKQIKPRPIVVEKPTPTDSTNVKPQQQNINKTKL